MWVTFRREGITGRSPVWRWGDVNAWLARKIKLKTVTVADLAELPPVRPA